MTWVYLTELQRRELLRRLALARDRYAEDCEARPLYPDGSPRESWPSLSLITQLSWENRR